MGLRTAPEDILIYILEIEVNRLDFNLKYPKNPKTFGERLRKKRMDLGLTMKELAEKLGVSETTAYNWKVRNIRPYRKTEKNSKPSLI